MQPACRRCDGYCPRDGYCRGYCSSIQYQERTAILERMTKLRGTLSQIQGRFETAERSPFDDGWAGEEKIDETFQTTVTEERARSIIARNDSPDIPFDQSINPYRGCEHGCIYCYARPTHAYL